jgi:hypothetical protein
VERPEPVSFLSLYWISFSIWTFLLDMLHLHQAIHLLFVV